MNKSEIKKYLLKHAENYVDDVFENDATPFYLATLGFFWETYNEFIEENPERTMKLNSELNEDTILQIIERVETSFDNPNLIDRLEDNDEPEKFSVEEHFKSKIYWCLASFSS